MTNIIYEFNSTMKFYSVDDISKKKKFGGYRFPSVYREITFEKPFISGFDLIHIAVRYFVGNIQMIILD